MTPAQRMVFALTAAATLLAGCTAVAEDSPPTTNQLPEPVQDDPTEIARLRAAAGLDDCPNLPTDSVPIAPAGLPGLTLPCLGDGPDVDLAALGGTPYVVNVWAGWCVPCRDEMPHLQEVYEQAAGRVGVLGIDFQDTPVGGLSAAADFGITFPSVQDLDGQTRPELRFAGPPFTAFVSAEGEVVATHIGQLTSSDELRDLIATHLGVLL